MIEFAITWLLILKLGGQGDVIPASGVCAVSIVSENVTKFECVMGTLNGSRYIVKGNLSSVPGKAEPMPEFY